MSTKFSVTIDAADPYELGKFWELALGYVREAPPPPHETWEETLTAWGLPQERWNDANALVDPDGIGPRIFLQKVPEAKTTKNRITWMCGSRLPHGRRTEPACKRRRMSWSPPEQP